MRKWILVLTIMALVAALVSCQGAAEKAAEQALEQAAEQNGVNLEIDDDSQTITVDDGSGSVTVTADGDWPEDAPDIIPVFEGGRIEATGSNMGSFISIADVSGDDATDYVDKLLNEGWSQQTFMNAANGFTYQGGKDGIQLTVTFADGVLVITWMGGGSDDGGSSGSGYQALTFEFTITEDYLAEAEEYLAQFEAELDAIEQAIAEVFTTDEYRQYLQTELSNIREGNIANMRAAIDDGGYRNKMTDELWNDERQITEFEEAFDWLYSHYNDLVTALKRAGSMK